MLQHRRFLFLPSFLPFARFGLLIIHEQLIIASIVKPLVRNHTFVTVQPPRQVPVKAIPHEIRLFKMSHFSSSRGVQRRSPVGGCTVYIVQDMGTKKSLHSQRPEPRVG